MRSLDMNIKVNVWKQNVYWYIVRKQTNIWMLQCLFLPYCVLLFVLYSKKVYVYIPFFILASTRRKSLFGIYTHSAARNDWSCFWYNYKHKCILMQPIYLYKLKFKDWVELIFATKKNMKNILTWNNFIKLLVNFSKECLLIGGIKYLMSECFS